jgi:hypothetical protein
MPLKCYTMMHSSAVIDPGQLEAICTWTEQAGEEVLGKRNDLLNTGETPADKPEGENEAEETHEGKE